MDPVFDITLFQDFPDNQDSPLTWTDKMTSTIDCSKYLDNNRCVPNSKNAIGAQALEFIKSQIDVVSHSTQELHTKQNLWGTTQTALECYFYSKQNYDTLKREIPNEFKRMTGVSVTGIDKNNNRNLVECMMKVWEVNVSMDGCIESQMEPKQFQDYIRDNLIYLNKEVKRVVYEKLRTQIDSQKRYYELNSNPSSLGDPTSVPLPISTSVAGLKENPTFIFFHGS